jgi:hypothetical protein
MVGESRSLRDRKNKVGDFGADDLAITYGKDLGRTIWRSGFQRGSSLAPRAGA